MLLSCRYRYAIKAADALNIDGELVLTGSLPIDGIGGVERQTIYLDKAARAKLRALLDKLDAKES